MWLESDRHGGGMQGGSSLHEKRHDALVPEMHAVEISKGHDRTDFVAEVQLRVDRDFHVVSGIYSRGAASPGMTSWR
jgi:hypothetical protein